MGTLERFNLRWDGFEGNTKVTLRQLKDEKEFFDVTLVGSDGNQVQANKVILAGGSTFFHKILKENPHPHPLIYLKGVSYQYLMSMLDFLYTGEVNIVQKDLNGFLDIAEDLKIKGLTATDKQTNSFPFAPAPLQRQGAADKAPLQSQGAADKPCLQGQVAAEARVLSPKITHPHSDISASCEGQVDTEEPGLSTRASYSRGSVSTTPVPLEGKQPILSPRESYPLSAVSTTPATPEEVATEECVLSRFPNVVSSVLSNNVTQATSNEDNDDTYKVKVEFEEGDAAYYNVSYGINDHGEHYIKHVSTRDLEDNAANIGSKSNISVSDGNPISRQNLQNGSGQSEVNQDEGMGLCSEEEAKSMKTLINASSNVVNTEVVNSLENNRCERDEMVVTEAADSGFINEQSMYDCGERSEETEEGELDFDEEKCFYCTKTFSTSELKKHKMMHIGEKQFQCLVCNKVFSTLHKLTVHHKKTHPDEKKFQCLVCFKRFTQSSHLNQHKRIHTGEKPYQCLQCFKRFTQISHLNQHKTSHTGEKPHQCLVCFKRFTHLSSLNQHMTTHAVEKLFQCLVCFKKFSRKHTLKLHEMQHTGEQPYQCVQCSKKFTRPCLLQEHKMTHVGEKTYQCVQCSKKFTRQYSLQDHKNIHTGEKPYQCLQCSKRFSHRQTFNKHKKIHVGKKS